MFVVYGFELKWVIATMGPVFNPKTFDKRVPFVECS